MSGGSYNYLFLQGDATPEFSTEDLENMASRLQALGFEEAAKDTREVLWAVHRFQNEDWVEENWPGLRALWKEVEWLDSADTALKTFYERLAKFANPYYANKGHRT